MDGNALDGRILECTWDRERSSWKYLRTREDKDTPNASHVHQKVGACLGCPGSPLSMFSLGFGRGEGKEG